MPEPETEKPDTSKTTGILGGSFNPPHRGHLALARTVLDLGLARRVILIPASIPPHKATPTQADARTRLAMARLLASEDDRLEVDDLELRRDGPSYTTDTLSALMNSNPGERFRVIIGSDLAKTFHTWRDYKRILAIAPPLVAERPDDIFGKPEDFAGMPTEDIRVILSGRFPMRHVDVSSTKVRALLERGADDGELLRYLTRPVVDFIRERGLYRQNT